MQKITPHLWFDKDAVEAAEFYTSVFDNAKITHKSRIQDTPSGDCDIVGFQIFGFDFMAISAGPIFKMNPSISFFVWCQSVAEVNELWQRLADGGEALMRLDTYPFSQRYGWIQDKYGVSWQVILVDEPMQQKITPCFMFANEQYGNAEEAIEMYTTIFPEGNIGSIERYRAGQGPEGKVVHGRFSLAGLDLVAMDSHGRHGFTFNEAISLTVHCQDQTEIDYFWEKLSAVPQAEQCGWVKDKFGVSWQIVPANMGELISKNPAQTTPVMLKMKKIVIADLVKAGG